MKPSSVFHLPPIAALYELLTGQAYWRYAIEAMLRHVEVRANGRRLRLLDLGCGPGESSFALAQRFPDAEVVGIDFANVMVARAKRRHRQRHPQLSRLRFEVADACDLPFDAGAFDLAAGHSFLYLVPDRAGVLHEAFRVLSPGGQILLMEPSAEASLARAAQRSRRGVVRALGRTPVSALRFGVSMLLWRAWSGAAGRLTPQRVRALLTSAGFAEVRVLPALGGLGLHSLGRRPFETQAVPGPAAPAPAASGR